jgi:hypothetical protein
MKSNKTVFTASISAKIIKTTLIFSKIFFITIFCYFFFGRMFGTFNSNKFFITIFVICSLSIISHLKSIGSVFSAQYILDEDDITINNGYDKLTVVHYRDIKKIDINTIFDSLGMAYITITKIDESQISLFYIENPFSLVEKIKEFKEAHFSTLEINKVSNAKS